MVGQKRRHDNRPTAAVRGYDQKWQQLQRDYLRMYPICCRCGCNAEMVDHIVPVRKDWSRRLDPGNLQALCCKCHKMKTDRMDYGKNSGVMPDTDASGWPTDPNHPWNSGVK